MCHTHLVWIEAMADDCVVPPPTPFEALPELLVKRNPREEQEIREYVEWQAKDEGVTHLEKVASEHVFGRRHDVWDVHTDKGRWWVITGPTNLYAQSHFPSMDYTLSFHVGLMARVAARDKNTAGVSEAEADIFAAAWRKWSQAAEAADQADEAEEFQAVGMRCREALLAFVKAASRPEFVWAGQQQPQAGNFVLWADLIVGGIASGSSAKELRSLLKGKAQATWGYVNWLTHAANAGRYDAMVAVDATEDVLGSMGVAYVRYERGLPERCPACASYKVVSVYDPDLPDEQPYRPLCEACGWAGAACPADGA
jgi:hypothetical protein